jgi:hypothetical protein
VIVPPATVQALLHVLLIIVTLAGAEVKVGQVGQVTGAVVCDALVLVQLVVVFLHLANTVNGVVVYVGTVVLHGPPALVAHSNTVPAPHPVAEIVPVVDGQTLFTMVIVGCVGIVHVPGTVVTAADIGLEMVLSISQLHLVSMLWAGPVWAYVGNVADQAPPFTLYCKVDPAGHGVPVGAVIVPPATVQALLHELLVTVTFGDVAVNDGQELVIVSGLQLELVNRQSPFANKAFTVCPIHVAGFKVLT